VDWISYFLLLISISLHVITIVSGFDLFGDALALFPLTLVEGQRNTRAFWLLA
jgi:hypothetical protein